ncbi:uncharacterized protein LOC100367751 [Saccoglossus kowalevskii]|uniref:Uncharacterized protein LOC100367751 n=1 Tax=Saccoglossus kowalevskii TaxID=10224 RepID=A0ABM0H1I1_SACKO|nr:PREDICTED: uncharacterized protein LOC100367751 [Saccoglossus kowalevskii]
MATTLDKLVTNTPLPCAVQVNGNYCGTTDDYDGPMLEDREVLLLHFTKEMQRVYATDNDGVQYTLPLTGQQRYQIMPLDSHHDDRSYTSIREIIEDCPLPQYLRVTKRPSTIHCKLLDCDEVIEVNRVEEVDGVKQLLVCNKNNYTIRLSETEESGEYSTNITVSLKPLPELIKEKLPLRVKIPSDSCSEKDDKMNGKILRLKSVATEKHVIATRPFHDEVLSIPLATPLQVFKITARDTDVTTVFSAMKALYKSVNSTWNIKDVGASKLPSSMQAVPQPLEDVLHTWGNSYQGRLKTADMCSKYTGEDQTDAHIYEPLQFKTESTVKCDENETVYYSTIKDESIDSMNDTHKVIDYKLVCEHLKGVLSVKTKKILELESVLEERDKLDTRMVPPKRNEELIQQVRPIQTEQKFYTPHSKQRILPRLNVPLPVVKTQRRSSEPCELHAEMHASVTVSDVCRMLLQLNLSQYTPQFEEEQIDGTILDALDEEILTTDLGMSRLHAKRLKLHLAKQKAEHSTVVKV